MTTEAPPGPRVSGRRLAELLGNWRTPGSRAGAADLAEGVRLLVLDGRLPAGTRLPAERELADAVGVSRTMIGGAMDRLRESGLIASRQGSGSWIRLSGSRHPADRPAQPELIDFARAVPVAVPGLNAAIDAVRPQLAELVAGPGYTEQGLLGLRERIAEGYDRRGLPTDPGQIVVTNGAHHAFVLVLRTLTGPGDRVLVEQPTYPSALDAIRAAHVRPVPVSINDDGWCTTGIEAALRQTAPRLAYLVVDFHNPTGLRLDAAGRERLGQVLRRTRTVAVVDETMVELDLTGDRSAAPPPLASFAGDWAISIGSASKVFWGGLRLGWIRASEEQVDRLLAARTSVDLGSPMLEQLILAQLLAVAEPQLADRRVALAAQRDVLADAVREHLPGWRFLVPDGGLSLWCELPEPISTRIAAAAPGFGLRVAPGARFGVHGGLERWMRLPYAMPAAAITDAVHRLSLAAASVRGARPADENRLVI